MLIISVSVNTYAALRETVFVYSRSMNKEIPAAVILPDSYTDSPGLFPVVYLLHGAGDDENAWPDRTDISGLCDKYNIIAVCPSAGRTSWYFDSPIDQGYRYETFVSGELVSFIDMKYRTQKKRSSRGIAGNSMGGHGALFLSIRHRDIFGAAASMSGGVDLSPFPEKWEIKKRLGPIEEFPERWRSMSVVNLADTLSDGDISISIDCGTGDFFLGVNRNLHDKLKSKGIKHIYTELPGKHDWSYWRKSLKYQMEFFNRNFSGNR